MFHFFEIYLFIAVCVSQSVESFLCGITKREGGGRGEIKRDRKNRRGKMREGEKQLHIDLDDAHKLLFLRQRQNRVHILSLVKCVPLTLLSA